MSRSAPKPQCSNMLMRRTLCLRRALPLQTETGSPTSTSQVLATVKAPAMGNKQAPQPLPSRAMSLQEIDLLEI